MSITLRHRLSCEIRSNTKVPLPAQYHDMCRIDHVKDHPVSPPPDDARRLSKFSAKLMIENKDELKTNMLVRVIECVLSRVQFHIPSLQVMNEVVVDRGPSPYLTNLDLCCNGRPMTSVQGDGI